MAAYRLRRWVVGHYAATETNPAHADVLLDGMRARGFIRRRVVQISEEVRVPLLPTDTADAKGSQALVKRAMAQSTTSWKGKP
ncbi:MAG TPA: hypothetical protein VFN11_14515 [Ktedonobacterales bacterium]|nr:hypothetical protein [Ktedonobacterales bacterium]